MEVPTLDRRDEVLETSRVTPVVRALVNAAGNDDLLERSEVDRMDVQGDPFLKYRTPNDLRGIP
jgi:hypothetical protein